MTKQDGIAVMWFRRDLRLDDNTALYHALRSGMQVLPLFIFDTNILDDLGDRHDRRVEFIQLQLHRLNSQLNGLNSNLQVRTGKPEEVFSALLKEYPIKAVFTNRDYEPYAILRDARIKAMLEAAEAVLLTYKDHVIFENREVVKDDGNPYTVFTPYSRKWKKQLEPAMLRGWPVEKYTGNFLSLKADAVPTLESIGFRASAMPFPGKEPDRVLIRHYSDQRDYPGIAGTSRLGIHLRFGTISIRRLVTLAQQVNDTYLNELIWRDFYQMILANYPAVGNGKAFKREYDNIRWRNNQHEFDAWCAGLTGYPLVDAGMRELNATGFMHNRVRMVTASFLCKHLLIDWRWGEAYFAKKLLDYDFASNNGGWQWAAGSGCDAAPYFRIFNPALQAKKFDPDGVYIRHWLPELEGFGYPEPIVNHEFARERCLEAYKAAINQR
ncbi:cryptochrome/photolyase family protein [Flavihumibacter petaseus]|uniref:Deoxyribodipyrimidine photolyase n=1 Tax=Flavihumibacter petaseus NBRC 106054 TaxID=1220578 RepID=A0A0E9N6Z5_9BACT|nr:deoxyribodipyrimidine photo-lyase [Flavihumibacter petaseus]GAO45573.1 deoxyribodipyrimidine photolyase [Flavihumibacter petaseus NBRC 106054]